MKQKLLPILGSSFLALCCASTFTWAFYRIQPTEAEHPLTAEPTQPVSPQVQKNLELVKPRPAVFYTAIAERPLFSPSRRPETEVAALEAQVVENAAPSDNTTAKFTLQGTLQIGEKNSALISLNAQTAVWLNKGESLADWTLSAVSPDSVEMTRNTEVIHVDLYPK